MRVSWLVHLHAVPLGQQPFIDKDVKIPLDVNLWGLLGVYEGKRPATAGEYVALVWVQAE
jgi:hypothetical protein